MPLSLNKAKKWLDAHGLRVVLGSMAAYVLALSALSFWKYASFAYDGFDLSYYHQIFWRTLHGDFFAQSLLPHLSLAHHVELVIPALVPFYALFPDPRTLLVLQTIAMALPALPIYLIARRRLGTLSSSLLRAVLPLFFPLAWLANPFVHAVNLDEFHILPFAIAPLFFALLAYEKERRLPFTLLLIAALLMQESVASVVIAFGVLAWMEKRRAWWMVFPSLLGGAWHIFALQIIVQSDPGMRLSFIAPAADAGLAAFGVLAALVAAILRIMSLDNALLLVAFGLPLLFLPYLAPHRLALSALPLLQILVRGEDAVRILGTNAAALLLPGIFLAAIEGSKSLPRVVLAMRGISPSTRRSIVALCLIAAMASSAAVLSPVPDLLRTVIEPATKVAAQEARSAVLRVAPTEEVAASAVLLPHLSGRYGLYTLPARLTPARETREVTLEDLPPTTDLIALDARHDELGILRALFQERRFESGSFSLYEKPKPQESTPAVQ